MSVNSTEQLDALAAILPERPTGRNIIGYACEEIKRLRSERDVSARPTHRDTGADAMTPEMARAGHPMSTKTHFTTIADLHAVPDAKVDALCEDLRLWLHLCRRLEGVPGVVARDTGTFKWVDDGEHNAYLRAGVVGLSEQGA